MRLGAEVWAVNTVQFSNHPGYGGHRGDVFSGAQIMALVDGIAERGVLGQCDAVLSGYLGSAEIGEAVLHAVSRVKQDNTAARYCCDPVIGDDGPGIYVRPGIDTLLRDKLLPLADIATPNRFELSHLTGLPTATLAQAKQALEALQAIGPRTVLVTSLVTEETPYGFTDMLAGQDGGFHLLRTPVLPLRVNGAGDALSGLFLFHMQRTGHAGQALAAAGSAMFGVLRHTAASGQRELQIVAAQQEFASPSEIFEARPC